MSVKLYGEKEINNNIKAVKCNESDFPFLVKWLDFLLTAPIHVSHTAHLVFELYPKSPTQISRNVRSARFHVDRGKYVYICIKISALIQ